MQSTPGERQRILLLLKHPVGAIGGIVGKTIAFFASLIAASLPITGFTIWWGRKNKSRAPGRKGEKKRVKAH